MSFVLDAAGLARLAADPAVKRAFPFLARNPAVRAGCGGCGAPARAPGLRAAAEAIASLPPPRVAALKSLIGTDKITVYVVRAARVVPKEL